jgi:hypothetical protein
MSVRLVALRLSCLALLFFGTLKSLIAQSPFVRSKAGFYTQLGWHTVPQYDVLFGDDGADQPLARSVSDHTIQLYGEYGINRKTTLMAVIPMRVLRRGAITPFGTLLSSTSAAGNLTTIGNTSLGIRHQLYEKNCIISASLRVDLPAPKAQDDTNLRSGYQAWTAVPMMSVGQGFRRAYWFGYGGFGLRTNNYSMFADTGIEGGVHFGRFWVIAFSQALLSLRNGDRPTELPSQLTGLYVDRQSWVSVGFKGIWEINRFTGLVLSAAGAPFARNVPKSPGLGMAAYFRWD